MNINGLINDALSCDLAIDAGAEMTLIYQKNAGVILKEPSYIAYDKRTKKIQAVGTEAYEMYSKAPKSVEVVKPIASGVINDFEMACKMFKRFITMACRKNLLKPRIIVSMPSQITDIEKRAMEDALKYAGARDVFIIEEPLAAAVGAGCDISLARGMLVADIGAGRCDVATVSLGHAVISKSIQVAGNAFTDEIVKYIRKNYGLNIGYHTAENIKKTIGCAYSQELSKTMEVAGCNITSGMPEKIIINSEELREILHAPLLKIANAIKTTLEDTPCELQSDILEDGILITGGGALLTGIDKWLRMETGIKVYIAENMTECVVKGAGAQLLSLDKPQNSQKYYYSLQ